MPGFADFLNEQSKPYFEAIDDGYVPSEYRGLTEGITSWESNTQQAFALNPPVAGANIDLRGSPGLEINLQPEGDRFILRTVIGYAMAAQCGASPVVFALRLSNLINAMVGAAYKVYGPRIQRVTFRRPREGRDYFRELEHTAGYEVRLYGELTPVARPLEMETVENG